MKKTFFAIIAILFTLTASTKNYNDDFYYTVDNPIFVDSADIIEFFSFYCHHCYQFDNIYNSTIRKKLPKDIKIVKYHVNFLGGKIGEILTKSWSVATVLDIQDKVKLPIFRYIQNQKYKDITNDLKKIFYKYANISPSKYDNTYNNILAKSFFIKQIKTAEQVKINSVPTILVKGKYILKIEKLDNSSLNNFIKEYVELIEFLMKKQ